MARIFTEDKNRRRVLEILDSHFPGYTVIPAIGRYERRRERSLIIEIDGQPLPKVRQVAEEIRVVNKQKEVKLEVGGEATWERIRKPNSRRRGKL
jgi:hypothetical protein